MCAELAALVGTLINFASFGLASSVWLSMAISAHHPRRLAFALAPIAGYFQSIPKFDWVWCFGGFREDVARELLRPLGEDGLEQVDHSREETWETS